MRIIPVYNEVLKVEEVLKKFKDIFNPELWEENKNEIIPELISDVIEKALTCIVIIKDEMEEIE